MLADPFPCYLLSDSSRVDGAFVFNARLSGRAAFYPQNVGCVNNRADLHEGPTLSRRTDPFTKDRHFHGGRERGRGGFTAWSVSTSSWTRQEGAAKRSIPQSGIQRSTFKECPVCHLGGRERGTRRRRAVGASSRIRKLSLCLAKQQLNFRNSGAQHWPVRVVKVEAGIAINKIQVSERLA